MTVQIDPELAETFKTYFESPHFTKEEHDYKWAVHLMLGRLLCEPYISSERFPGLLAKLMKGELTPQDVYLSAEETAAVEQGLSNVSGGLYGAISNLCGGRWGTVQLDWIPIAVGKGLGSDLRTAFGNLVREAHEAFLKTDVPVRDLIDTQSLLYMRGHQLKTKIDSELTEIREEIAEAMPSEAEIAALETLCEETLWPIQRALQLVKLASRGKPLLFSGPPGNGQDVRGKGTCPGYRPGR